MTNGRLQESGLLMKWAMLVLLVLISSNLLGREGMSP